MAGSSDVRAGGAFVEIGGDLGPLDAALKQATAKLKSWGGDLAVLGAGVAAIGTAISAPILAGAKQLKDYGSAMRTLAERAGMTATAMSELAYAAKITDTDVNALAGGIRKMQMNLAAAASGDQDAIDSFARLGLTYEDLANKSPDEQFKMIAEGMSGITNASTKTTMAMDMFGKSGVQLIPMLDQGAEGIQAFQQEARLMGASLSEDMAQKAEKAEVAMKRFNEVVGNLSQALGGSVISQLTEFVNTLTKWIIYIRLVVEQNQKLIAQVFYFGGALVALGGIMAGVGAAFLAIGAIGIPMLAAIVLVSLALVMGLDWIRTACDKNAGSIFDMFNAFTIGGATAHQWLQRFSLFFLSIINGIREKFAKMVVGIVDGMLWMVEKTMTLGNKMGIVSDQELADFKKGRANTVAGMTKEHVDPRTADKNANLDAIAEMNDSSLAQGENKGKLSLTDLLKKIKKEAEKAQEDIAKSFPNGDPKKKKTGSGDDEFNSKIPKIPSSGGSSGVKGILGAFGGRGIMESLGAISGPVQEQQLKELQQHTELLRKMASKYGENEASYA